MRGDGFFNPYSDHCDQFDQLDAPAIRRRNLQAYLEGCLDHGARTIWIARDLGYRGGRRTGLPLTDEAHLDAEIKVCGRSNIVRATTGELVAERTASVVWSLLRDIHEPVVLWNVFPFHPHEHGNPLSNRQHTRRERETTLPLFDELRSIFKPSRIFAIGRDAQYAMSSAGIQAVPVRHPSYGGQTEFTKKVRHAYSMS